MFEARFIGDPRHDGEGPERMTVFEVEFVKGEWADVPAFVASRLSVNNHFEVREEVAEAVAPEPVAEPEPEPVAEPEPVEAEPVEDPAVEPETVEAVEDDAVSALRAQLDALGITYHHRAGVERLTALLNEANDAG